MKKGILIGLVLTLIVVLSLTASCAAGVSPQEGVSQQEYDRVTSELDAANTQIESLEADLSEAQGQVESLTSDLTEAQTEIASLRAELEVPKNNSGKALAYAEFMDIIMYPAWKEAGLAPRFTFEDDMEWLMAVMNRASDMEDAKLSDLISGMKQGDEATMFMIWDHCIDAMQKALK